jgi:hypothetical protein
VVVGGVEHVGVLFDPLTHREAANWFDAAFGRTPAAGDRAVGLRPVQRAGSALLLHLAAVLSFGAIAALLLGRGPRLGEGHGRVPVPVALGVPAIAVLAAIPVMAVVPRGWLPLAVAAPVAAFFGTVGVVCLAAVRLTGHGPGRGAGGRSWRATAVAAVALVVLTVVSFAVPAELGWAHAVPVGPRAWTLIPITACTAAFFGGLEALCTGHDRRTAVLIHVWTATGALAGLCLAVFAGAAPSFVLLVAPLLAGLLVWQGVQAAALRANRAPRWLTALVGGVLLAWPIAVTMPIS